MSKRERAREQRAAKGREESRTPTRMGKEANGGKKIRVESLDAEKADEQSERNTKEREKKRRKKNPFVCSEFSVLLANSDTRNNQYH